MDNILQEIRLSRAFACAFYDAIQEGDIEVPKDLMDTFLKLKEHYDEQMNRELS